MSASLLGAGVAVNSTALIAFVWAAAVKGIIPARRQVLMVVIRVFIDILLWLRIRMLETGEHGEHETYSQISMLDWGFDTV
jgi:hypothetical protein